MSNTQTPSIPGFTPYQKFVVGLLAFLQFAIVLDFMIMAPLGALIMPALRITTAQFGHVVSAYAFSAGIAGLVTAGFADRFDRRKLLLFFYIGFIAGTLACGLAPTYETLLLARIVTGLFGGVIGSIVMAIAADLFAPQMRGRVMGLIQTAFAVSQVAGLPLGLYLSNRWNWHVPFLAMVGVGVLGGGVAAWGLKPVDGHLAAVQEHSPWMHLFHTLVNRRHHAAFATTALLTTGGFMLMPFSSVYMVSNLGFAAAELPLIFLITGLASLFIGPLVGRSADAFGKYPVFAFGSAVSIVMVLVYTHLGSVSLPVFACVNVVMFVGIFSRMIPFQALVASVPEPSRRGAFNAINASIQQISGGIASVLAGYIVTLGADGRLQHFDLVGYVVAGTAVLSLALARQVNLGVQQRAARAESGGAAGDGAAAVAGAAAGAGGAPARRG